MTTAAFTLRTDVTVVGLVYIAFLEVVRLRVAAQSGGTRQAPPIRPANHRPNSALPLSAEQ